MYERNPQAQLPLIQAMEEACGDIAPEAFQGWIRHTRPYFPRCLARENVACDVDEVQTGTEDRMQPCVFVLFYFTFFFPFMLTVLPYFLLFVLCKSFTHPVVLAVMYRLQHFWKK